MQIATAVSSSEFDWFTSCRAIDAMVMFNTPFRGQQELSLIGDEQTTSLLVVMIVCGALPHTRFFLNFLITPPFWYSYSLPFSVLCVAE